MKKTILVSGGYGQLGFEINRLSSEYPAFEFIFSDRDSLDITDPGAVEKAFEQYRPVYFINCAAYTAVDKAETERDIALAINATAVGIIATCCSKHQTKLIHVSTDYVFNGKGTRPYRTDDVAAPLNYYGETKYQGEQLALRHCADTVIIRTAWVYSEHGNNFVKTMLRLMGERQELGVVNDQIGSPTYARDLAAAILHIVKVVDAGEKAFEPGLYHYTNTGVISWFDFATAIKEIGQQSCVVKGIPSTAYPTPAARPGYSVMDTEKIAEVYGVVLAPWRPSLEDCIGRLQAK